MDIVSLKVELQHELKLTPQILQSIEILQMDSQGLLEYLNKAAEENPLLDLQNSSSLQVAFKELQQKASWLDAGAFDATFSHEDAHFPEQGRLARETESLSAFLCDQLDRKHLPAPLLALTKYMAELVDEDGYLTTEDLDGIADLKVPAALIDEALSVIQSLDPAGIGARSLSECLLLQLARLKNTTSSIIEIVSRFLPELGKKHYRHISRELGLTSEEIFAAEKVISSLDPHPGRAYQPTESPPPLCSS